MDRLSNSVLLRMHEAFCGTVKEKWKRWVVSAATWHVRCRRAAAAATAIGLLVAGCSSSSDEPVPPATAAQSSEQPQSETAGVDPSPVVPVQTVRSGLVVETRNDQRVTIGFVDPQTGNYSKHAVFENVDFYKDETLLDSHDIRLAPDLLRYAVTRKNSNTVGWVNEDGSFTDVTPEGVPSGPFDGPAPAYQAIGFDGAGNFYFTEQRDLDVAWYVVKASDGSRVAAAEPLDPPGNLKGKRTSDIARNGAGELYARKWSCGKNRGPYISLDRAALIPDMRNDYTDRTLIVRKVDEEGCGVGTPADKVSLLPEANESRISNPVGSPDGQHVAFRRNVSELWITDSNGGGAPREVELNGIDLDESTTLVGWT